MKKKDLLFSLRDVTVRTGAQGLTQVQWKAAETAVILCDMWDQHWCKGATSRVQELAPRMEQVISHLRDAGVQIVHAPSDTLDYYAAAPERLSLLHAAEGVGLSPSLQGEALLNKEPKLPIDRDGVECDCGSVKCVHGQPWAKQCDTLTIQPGDWIGDGLEILQAFRATGIVHVLMMGVHTNLCIVGRPFGIRNLLRYGFQPVLVRDMTDCMAPSEEAPFFNHFTGLDYVIRHIETYLCPTVDSGQLLGDGKQLHFTGDTRTKQPTGMELDETMRQFLNRL